MDRLHAAAGGGRIPLDMPHPRPAAWFEQHVATVVEFVGRIREQIAAGKHHILVKAPVKSGKRLMVEFIAVLLGLRMKYITSLNRKDVQVQKDELERYGVRTHLTSDEGKVDDAIDDVQFDLRNGHTVIACFDECDYGSGARQKLAKLYEEFIDCAAVVKIYFSATAHEAAASDLSMRADYVVLTYVPPPTYCGAEYFLTNGLVFEPQAFFEMEDGDPRVRVTEHGIHVIRASITPERHIGVVRTTRAIPTAHFKIRAARIEIERQLYAAMPDGKPWKIVPVDEKDSHDWENRNTRIGYTADREFNYLFVIMQTCTRGTDLKGWHSTLAFWHDKRGSDTVNLNTMIQAVLRPCHYSSDYGGVSQRVRLYVDRRVVQMAADDDMDAYLESGGKVPARTKTASPRRPATGWGVPIRVVLPDHVLAHSDLRSNLTSSRREWFISQLMPLLTDAEREILSGRALKTKRTYDRTSTGGGIFTVHRAYVEGRGTHPGGGNPNGIEEIRNTHFWLDIATEPLEGIASGTAYITYGTVEERDIAAILKTTRASMFEARRGEL